MRIAAQVFLFYGLGIVFGGAWRYLPLDRAAPDLVALFAVYLGLTARGRIAPATCGAIIIGYLADLLMGSPPGMQALVGGIACILVHVVHRRLLVEGWTFAAVFSFFAALAAGLVTMLVRSYFGVAPLFLPGDAVTLFESAVATGLLAPVVFRLCRAVDGRFLRSGSDPDSVLEGLSP